MREATRDIVEVGRFVFLERSGVCVGNCCSEAHRPVVGVSPVLESVDLLRLRHPGTCMVVAAGRWAGARRPVGVLLP